MIIDSDSYKRNSKGQISKRETVKIECDICKSVWKSKYEYRLRRKYKEDLCPTCRRKRKGKIFHENFSGFKKSKIVICLNCRKRYKQYACYIKKNQRTFCSNACKDAYIIEKYKHLEESFIDHPNEVAYLFGLILGDGHLKSGSINGLTTKIVIAFNVKDKTLIKYAKSILETLRIHFVFNSKPHNNCLALCFSISSSLLQKHSMLWSGNKFDIQPSPSENISNNIHFAAGLINSDGHFHKDKQGYCSITFTNTVESIINAYKKCLDYNNISYKRYTYIPKVDKRSNNTYKRSWFVKILRKHDLEKIRRLVPQIKWG